VNSLDHVILPQRHHSFDHKKFQYRYFFVFTYQFIFRWIVQKNLPIWGNGGQGPL